MKSSPGCHSERSKESYTLNLELIFLRIIKANNNYSIASCGDNFD